MRVAPVRFPDGLARNAHPPGAGPAPRLTCNQHRDIGIPPNK
jgi:hypothetical protein